MKTFVFLHCDIDHNVEKQMFLFDLIKKKVIIYFKLHFTIYVFQFVCIIMSSVHYYLHFFLGIQNYISNLILAFYIFGKQNFTIVT